MKIHCEVALTQQERVEVDAWVKAHRADDIDSVSVDARVVGVHRSLDRFAAAAGTALRQGDLKGELTIALANLNRIYRIARVR